MASAFIVARRLADGSRRYQVRYRLGGRESTPRYGGQFRTKREAEGRRNAILGDLAALRVPVLAVSEPDSPDVVTVKQAADEVIAALKGAGRSASTVKVYRLATAKLGRLEHLAVTSVGTSDVQGWLTTECAGLSPATTRKYLDCLRTVLDRDDVPRNPARSRRLLLPSLPAKHLDPPSTGQVAAMVEHIAPRHRDALRLLDWTGLRISELCALTWGDLDRRNTRIRVAATRTKGGTRGRRFIPVPVDIMRMLEAHKPLEDRNPHERIFPTATRSSFANALERACKFAGVPTVSPHDIRHRYISLLVMAGTPITIVQEVVGHSKASMTLDTYSHTMIDETTEALTARRAVVERRAGGVTGGVTETPRETENPAEAGRS